MLHPSPCKLTRLSANVSKTLPIWNSPERDAHNLILVIWHNVRPVRPLFINGLSQLHLYLYNNCAVVTVRGNILCVFGCRLHKVSLFTFFNKYRTIVYIRLRISCLPLLLMRIIANYPFNRIRSCSLMFETHYLFGVALPPIPRPLRILFFVYNFCRTAGCH